MFPFFKNKQIARIEIIGVIDRMMRNRTLEALEKVEREKFPALVVRIDSPGGTVVDSQEICQALKQLQSKMKVVSSFGNISASGGGLCGDGNPVCDGKPRDDYGQYRRNFAGQQPRAAFRQGGSFL